MKEEMRVHLLQVSIVQETSPALESIVAGIVA